MRRRTPLYERHRQLGARMGAFAGYEMPLQYLSILQEHRTTRRAAGIFDLSHMGEIEVSGRKALGFLQWRTTNDVERLRPGRAQYSLLLNEAGGIEDDVVLYRREEDRFLLVVNAANREKMVEDLAARAPAEGVRVTDQSDETALIAVQGPAAESICQEWAGQPLSSLRYYDFAELQAGDVRVLVSRTGYTGEDGFELFLPAERATSVWDTLLGLGRAAGATPAGLGARDTLRLEMGYSLYGHEIDASRTPWEAGLGWVVKLGKGDFVGREALIRIQERGVARRLVGLVMEGRGGVPRQGYPVLHQGAAGGEVTSGAFSPTLERRIALAYVPAEWAAAGMAVEVEARGERLPARVVGLPFVSPRVRR